MRLLKWLLGMLLCAWVGQYLLAVVAPNLVMELVYWQGAKHGGYNRLVVRPVPDATSRTIVRPSPDLLYASCIYNLKDGPIVIEAPIPTRYWSMQFYQMNTDNFAGITNQREQKSRVGSIAKVTLIRAGDDPANYQGEVIQSPTDRGIMLLRASAIGDRTEQQAALDASRCGPA
jgi:uncharacterized membrane protein